MGSTEVPSQSSDTIQVPTANYEFDGRLSARVKCDLADYLTLKINAQLTNQPHYSQGMFNFDYKGKDYRTQLQLGNNAFYGANYIQNVYLHICHWVVRYFGLVIRGNLDLDLLHGTTPISGLNSTNCEHRHSCTQLCSEGI